MLDVANTYDDYFGRVYAFMAYRVVSVVDAEDLASETFERVVRSAARFDPEKAGVATWIFTIAERVLIDYYRRSGRREPTVVLEDDQHDPVWDDAPFVGPTPELCAALERLSERQRTVIGLRFGGDLSAQEIARIVGTSEANVFQILSRSLRDLRAALDEPATAGEAPATRPASGRASRR